MRRFAIALALVAAVAGVRCAPSTPPVKKNGGVSVAKNGDDVPHVPDPLKERIEAALDQIRRRDLLTDHAFWTIFHGILGQGFDVTLLNPETNERIRAIDHICQGKPVRGLKFVVTPHGLDVQTAGMGSDVLVGVGQGHQDQFIAEMAQWGMEPSQRFVVEGRTYSFQDFINHSKMRASVKQKQELSWAILIVGQFFGTDAHWTNGLGESLTLEDVLRYELDQPMDVAACGGTHRLFGITWVVHLRRNQGRELKGVWLDAVKALEDHKLHAKKHRNADGCFSTDYFKGPGNKEEMQLRIGTTGHILEWLALYLPDSELKEPWVQDAAAGLARLVLLSGLEPVEAGALYHAAHGLHLYHDRVYGDPKAARPYPLPRGQ